MEACSYSDQQCLKPFLRDLDAIILEGKDVALDCLTDIADRDLAALALRNATRQAGAFRNPEAILAGINDCLSHEADSADPVLTLQLRMSPLALSLGAHACVCDGGNRVGPETRALPPFAAPDG